MVSFVAGCFQPVVSLAVLAATPLAGDIVGFFAGDRRALHQGHCVVGAPLLGLAYA
jgi:hypothetical protein